MAVVPLFSGPGHSSPLLRSTCPVSIEGKVYGVTVVLDHSTSESYRPFYNIFTRDQASLAIRCGTTNTSHNNNRYSFNFAVLVKKGIDNVNIKELLYISNNWQLTFNADQLCTSSFTVFHCYAKTGQSVGRASSQHFSRRCLPATITNTTTVQSVTGHNELIHTSGGVELTHRSPLLIPVLSHTNDVRRPITQQWRRGLQLTGTVSNP